MKPRDYCCCAIPLVNAGIYAALAEQLILGIVAGALAIGTPSSQSGTNKRLFLDSNTFFLSVVGASTPSFAGWVFGVVCFVGAALQFLGIMGVLQVCSLSYHTCLDPSYLTISSYFLRKNQTFFVATCSSILSRQPPLLPLVLLGQ
jgi:hypothetical protein